MSKEIDGYISKIELHGKVYKLRCEITEIYPLVCPKCGAAVELKYGTGKCEYCGTTYTTKFEMIEETHNAKK
ncbi:MAG: hypothetical protein E7396_10015 [Ruminococcaceae bacterium]|nr:hypothetical protein [Oscillospiraceae bacterium]